MMSRLFLDREPQSLDERLQAEQGAFGAGLHDGGRAGRGLSLHVRHHLDEAPRRDAPADPEPVMPYSFAMPFTVMTRESSMLFVVNS